MRRKRRARPTVQLSATRSSRKKLAGTKTATSSGSASYIRFSDKSSFFLNFGFQQANRARPAIRILEKEDYYHE